MRLFVTGIGTDVGKTIASAIITEALKADYWKPIQAGELEHTDTHKVQELVSNTQTTFHPEAYRLQQPMSPHAAAEKDDVQISLNKIQLPQTDNHLVIEGAGGLLVPLNQHDCIIDLIPHLYAEAVLVSQNYLGSINHTLLSIQALQARQIPIKGVLFNGPENKETEAIICTMGQVVRLGRIDQEKCFTAELVKTYAQRLLPCLC